MDVLWNYTISEMNPREKELNHRGREWGADFQALALPHRRFMVACGLYVGYTKTAQHSTKFTFELFFFFFYLHSISHAAFYSLQLAIHELIKYNNLSLHLGLGIL